MTKPTFLCLASEGFYFTVFGKGASASVHGIFLTTDTLRLAPDGGVHTFISQSSGLIPFRNIRGRFGYFDSPEQGVFL
jgi:hypothetical protein